MAVREVWPQALVIGVDTHDIIETAIRRHAIDVGSDDLAIAGEADLLVLAGGLEENDRVLPYLAEAIPGDAIVLVIGGGGALAERAHALPARLPVVSGLPSVEPEGRGMQAATADLYRGRPWTLTPVAGRVEAAARVRELVLAIGGAAADAVPSA
jgi:hypothetical protein